MKMPFLLISPKIVPKIQLIKKGGCFEYHAVIADKIKYRYVHRASICPALGMDRRSFFMPKPMGKYKRLEVFYLSKPVYTADKPSDCHYCYFWTNGRKGCRLGRNNCYYLISLPPKPKSECDGCPYGRDHPCIGWCTKKVTSIGQRLKFVRRFRRLTQKELGLLMGYSEKTADVRIAQYEKNARTPNAETTAKLAEVLKVSPVVFSPTICASREDLLQSMYWLFLMKGGGDIYDCETEYARSRMEQKLGVITVEEFLEKILVN